MRFALTLFLVSGYIFGPSAFAEEPTKEQLDFFEKKIRPVLVKHCYECHSADSKEVKGGLLLDTREGLQRGGESGGHGVVPGEPDQSVLMEALRYESFEMPPDQQLPENVIADFEKWIKMGAPDPREGKALIQNKIDFEAAKKYWAYQPLTKPEPPKTKTNWADTDIDKFLLAKMEAAGVTPVEDAAPATLIRRVYFDLVGLPPTPAQVEEYVANPTPARLGEIVDRLLASPQFGERWGRHWLDVVRYGESTGMERNFTFPHAWRYRDYVIESFNEDKPFDRFIAEQIAGDLLPANSPEQRQEQLTATGFLAIGPKSLNERNREQFAMDIVDDQIDVTSRAFLGLTVACARCHDHKFDAIPQDEYYAMAGIFRSTDTFYGTGGERGNRQSGDLLALVGGEIKPVKPAGGGNNNNTKNLAQQLRKAQKQLANLEKREKNNAVEKRITQIENQVKKLKRQLAKAKSGDEEEAAEEQKSEKPEVVLMGVLDTDNPADTELRVRGEPDDRGKKIPRGFLTVASRFDVPEIKNSTSGRLELARWITDPKNPLTARVAVNRFWQHVFGRGIVGDVNNFGINGEKPTHPELLDYLAASFIENGWSVKQFVRSIVMSRAYRLSTLSHEEGLAADPDNYLLWRQNQRRLEAEALRDAMLLASGELDLTPANGSIVARVGNGDIGRGINASEFSTTDTKRSVYLPIVRNAVPEALQVFDFPEPSIIAGQRDVTTVPTQALFMLNSPFVLDRSKALAERLLKDDSLTTDEQRITRAFQYSLCREPSAEEFASAKKFLSETLPMSEKSGMEPEIKAWMGFCHVLLASSEFRYLQ